MITYSSIVDKDKLIETITDNNRFGYTKEDVEEKVYPFIETCLEIYYNDILAGYFLIMFQSGIRSFHGYKLIKGHSVEAVRIVKKFIKDYSNLFISHHSSNDKVNRLAKILGFVETLRVGKAVCLKNS